MGNQGPELQWMRCIVLDGFSVVQMCFRRSGFKKNLFYGREDSSIKEFFFKIRTIESTFGWSRLRCTSSVFVSSAANGGRDGGWGRAMWAEPKEGSCSWAVELISGHTIHLFVVIGLGAHLCLSFRRPMHVSDSSRTLMLATTFNPKKATSSDMRLPHCWHIFMRHKFPNFWCTVVFFFVF